MRKLVETASSNNVDSAASTATTATEQSRTVGKSLKHESAIRQVSGSARYIDDMPEAANLHYAAVGTSHIARGVITALDLTAVRNAPGVIDVITIDDVPGHKDIAPVFDGDPLLADQQIKFFHQPVFAVLADTMHNARVAATLAKLEVTPTEPVFAVKQALAEQRFVRPTHTMQRGDISAALAASPHQVSGALKIGGQEHMYLEGQVSMAIPEEEDRVTVYTSSQHPSEVQKLVAEVLNVKLNRVCVDMRRMGGGFGGKETQAAQWACLSALLASRNGVGVKIRLPRQQDMQVTGKRHPFENHYTVGFDDHGVITATDIEVNGDCGHSADLSEAIVDRAMFHADNGYYYPTVKIVGHRLQTDYVSHTAFRGFGGPQGMIMAETIIDAIARKVGADPLTIRKRNLYQAEANAEGRNITPYGMSVEHNLLPEMIATLEHDCEYWQRREAITAFNATSPIIKKGLALTPVKFGISFTAKHLNQAGALVHVYTDGSIQVNHGGTEMGQGLHTKIAQIAAHEFGLELDAIEVTATRTDKVPNTSPTAASSGTDLNGKAVQNACLHIKQRLIEFYATQVNQPVEHTYENAYFADGKLTLNGHSIGFTELVQQAYFARVSLSASGFYKTPKIHYDRETASGRPFFYFSYGVSCSEVTIDTLTGEYKVDRTDILHDVGSSLNPAIDIGQIEGGFIQGMGWLTTEDLRWNDEGRLISDNMATYKIPAIGDTPEQFTVKLHQRANAEDSIYHSKAVGEPPFMLAFSVWCALKDAIASVADYKVDPPLNVPATPEQVLNAVMAIQEQNI